MAIDRHMEKTLSVLILCLLAVSLQAQDRLSFSVEVAAGAGVGRGPLVEVTPAFVAQYAIGSGFCVGAGAGIRVALPCLQYITDNGGTPRRTFCNEFDAPLFLRLGYGKDKFFVNVDAGYALPILSFFGLDWAPGGKKEASYGGFFVEPQFGLRLGRRSALTLGVLLQQSGVYDHINIEHGKMGDPDYSLSGTVTRRNLLTPAITLRYGVFF